MYFYNSHLGGIYTSDEYLSPADLYCDTCMDYDDFIGKYDSWEDFITKLDEETGDFFCFNVDYLCEQAGITKERFKELNPKFYEQDREYYGYQDEKK